MPSNTSARRSFSAGAAAPGNVAHSRLLRAGFGAAAQEANAVRPALSTPSRTSAGSGPVTDGRVPTVPWRCSVCTTVNSAGLRTCTNCGAEEHLQHRWRLPLRRGSRARSATPTEYYRLDNDFYVQEEEARRLAEHFQLDVFDGSLQTQEAARSPLPSARPGAGEPRAVPDNTSTTCMVCAGAGCSFCGAGAPRREAQPDRQVSSNTFSEDDVSFLPPAGFAFATAGFAGAPSLQQQSTAPSLQRPSLRPNCITVGRVTTYVVSATLGGSPDVVEARLSDGRRYRISEPPELEAATPETHVRTDVLESTLGGSPDVVESVLADGRRFRTREPPEMRAAATPESRAAPPPPLSGPLRVRVVNSTLGGSPHVVEALMLGGKRFRAEEPPELLPLEQPASGQPSLRQPPPSQPSVGQSPAVPQAAEARPLQGGAVRFDVPEGSGEATFSAPVEPAAAPLAMPSPLPIRLPNGIVRFGSVTEGSAAEFASAPLSYSITPSAAQSRSTHLWTATVRSGRSHHLLGSSVRSGAAAEGSISEPTFSPPGTAMSESIQQPNATGASRVAVDWSISEPTFTPQATAASRSIHQRGATARSGFVQDGSISEPTFSPPVTMHARGATGRSGFVPEGSISEPTFSPPVTMHTRGATARSGFIPDGSISEPTFSPPVTMWDVSVPQTGAVVHGEPYLGTLASGSETASASEQPGSPTTPAQDNFERVELTVMMFRDLPGDTMSSWRNAGSLADASFDSAPSAHADEELGTSEPVTPRTLPFSGAAAAPVAPPAIPPLPIGWSCAACSLHNVSNAMACKFCGEVNPAVKVHETEAVLPMDMCMVVPESFRPGMRACWATVQGPHGPLLMKVPEDATPGSMTRVRLGPNASYRVTLPPHAREGDTLSVEPPEGELVHFHVPAGRRGGEALDIVPRVLMVRVPDGAAAGDCVAFNSGSSGGRRLAKVPRGVTPGQYFDVPMEQPA